MPDEYFSPVYSTDNIWRDQDMERSLSDDLDFIDKDISDLKKNKADKVHTHTEYAPVNHAHNNYATTSHSHAEYAVVAHNHDSDYAPFDHVHDEYDFTSDIEQLQEKIGDTNVSDQINEAVSLKANKIHSHDDSYAPLKHTHTDYASTSHTHKEYAQSNHSHTEYALSNDVDVINERVGDTSVAAQINEAMFLKADKAHTHTVGQITDLSTELASKYVKPVNGIPKTDLSEDIQLSLKKADSAVQSVVGFATESYVNTKVSDLVNSAPETLDTLNELAAALGNDPNFATTVANQIGNKVDKVSGKGLSTNDYTAEEKTKLKGIETGANKTVVDVALSGTSANPVQNKVVNEAINNLNTLVGDTAVSEQIANSTVNTANKLASARTITVGSASKAFDGSNDIAYSLNDVGALSLSNVGEHLAQGTNIDELDYGNFYVASATEAATMQGDIPLDTSGYRLIHMRGYSASYDRQIALTADSDIMQRIKLKGVWKPWQKLSFADHTHVLTSDSITGYLSVTKGGTGASDIKIAANNLMVKSLYAGVLIPANSDLNNYTTPGNYTCNKSADVPSLSNCPVAVAFGLTVYYVLNASYLKQEINEYNSETRYERHCINGTWGEWRVYYTSGKKPTPADIGAATSGHTHALSGSTVSGLLPLSKGGTGETTAWTNKTVSSLNRTTISSSQLAVFPYLNKAFIRLNVTLGSALASGEERYIVMPSVASTANTALACYNTYDYDIHCGIASANGIYVSNCGADALAMPTSVNLYIAGWYSI